ncbi:HEAT repeat domain-containing protein [Acidobacteriota bacterium]
MCRLKRSFFAPFIVFLVVLLGAAASLHAFQVKHHSDPEAPLKQRWQWGIAEAARNQFNRGFWIGYSIKILMGEHSYYISTDDHTMYGHFSPGYGIKGTPLEEILSGKLSKSQLSGEEQVKIVAREALERAENPNQPEKKVWKDVGILFKYDSPKDKNKEPSSFRISNLEVPFESKGLPIIWLGHSKDSDSLVMAQEFYKKFKSERWKKRIISLIGSHSDSETVVPLLIDILNSKQSVELRKRAASELGDHAHPEALQLLHKTAMADRSVDVRRRAASSLEDMELDGAVDALVEIARKADHRDVRRSAISALGDKASQRAASVLEDLVYEDDDTEIQKRAVSALEDLPPELGIPVLIKVAKSHPKLSVRKRAINTLGDSEDPRALETLIELLKR